MSKEEAVNASEEEEVWDSIVIGSGIGGLAAASLLSQCQRNHRVLILEQNKYHAGGCCQSFERNGFPFGVGIHYVGGMSEGEEPKKLLDALTPEGDPIEWTRMQDNFESVYIGKNEPQRFDNVAGRQEEALIEQFPQEKEAIRKFFELARKAAATFPKAFIGKGLPRPLASAFLRTGIHRCLDDGYKKYANMTLAEVVESLTDNSNLRAVLEYISDCYGTLPKDAPFVVHATVFLSFSKGAYYPSGGPGKIPEKISKAIKACGGEIRVNNRVKHVLVEGGRAAGVELVDGTKIKSKQIISDAGYVNTFQQMIPVEYRPKASPAISTEKLENGQSAIVLYVGLEGDHDKDFCMPKQNLCIIPDCSLDTLLDRLPCTLYAFQNMDPEDLPLFITCPSCKDCTWKTSNPGKTTIEIIMFLTPWNVFSELLDGNGGLKMDRKEEYNKFKRIFGQLVWARSRQVLIAAGASTKLPENLEDADVAEVATPLTFAHFLGSKHGAIYGLDHTRYRFHPHQFHLNLRPDSPDGLPGLYITGQDVACAGMVGALYGAYACASKVLGVKNPIKLQKKVNTNRAKQSEHEEHA